MSLLVALPSLVRTGTLGAAARRTRCWRPCWRRSTCGGSCASSTLGPRSWSPGARPLPRGAPSGGCSSTGSARSTACARSTPTACCSADTAAASSGSRSATPASRFPATKRPPKRGTPPWPPRVWSPSAFRSLPRPSSSTSRCDRPRLRHAHPPLHAASAVPRRRPRRPAATSVSVCRGRSETRPLGATSLLSAKAFCQLLLRASRSEDVSGFWRALKIELAT
uniref:Secreted protein n=1 Tax=Ixodes ricinus TaxID=34613 RepID=A0A6B0V3M8_IXORI